MEFFRRAPRAPGSLALYSGAFNPPTVAHVELARLALEVVDEVLFVLPRVFPHKAWEGAGFDLRLRWLQAALRDQERCSIAATEQGLFLEIAQAARQAYGENVRLSVLVGRDAAERIAGWDYGDLPPFPQQLETFDLLVASRGGEYQAPDAVRDKVRRLPLEPHFQEVSSSEVRRRIQSGEPWRHLVPGGCLRLIEESLEVFTASASSA